MRWFTSRGLTERHALRRVNMSASALRYQPRLDRNTELRKTIVQLVQRHRRYGAEMIEPDKPNQNAYVESFNGRFRDECLNEHWFISSARARAEIERWRREYYVERPKKSWWLPPAVYAKQPLDNALTMPGGL